MRLLKGSTFYFFYFYFKKFKKGGVVSSKYLRWLFFLVIGLVMFGSISQGFAQSNVALNRPYVLSPHSGNPSYLDDGIKLTDNVSLVSLGEWSKIVGYYGEGVTIVVDLGSVQMVDMAELYCFLYTAGSIYLPSSCAFSSSVDGSSYASLVTVSTGEQVLVDTYKFVGSFPPVSARYIKFETVAVGQWNFYSEVAVYSSGQAATQLAFIQQPSNTEAGSVVTPFVSVQLKDSLLNNVLLEGVSVSLSLDSGAGVLNGTLSRLTSSSGLAIFSDLSSISVGSKTLLASSVGLVSAVSSSFSITEPLPPPPPPPPPPTYLGVVFGRVLDRNMRPVSRVSVLHSSVDYTYLGVNPVFTDSDGFFYLEDCDTSKSFSLRMSKSSYGEVIVERIGTDVASLVEVPDQILISGGGVRYVLSGVVKNSSGVVQDFVRLKVKGNNVVKVCYSDASGSYTLGGLLPGNYTIEGIKGNKRVLKRVSVSGNVVTNLTIK